MDESTGESQTPRDNVSPHTAGEHAKALNITLLLAFAAMLVIVVPILLGTRARGTRNLSPNSLKQIGLGLYAYSDATGSIPAAYTQDGAGNRLLSWRVALLPYLEESVIAEKFNQDEPWDGPGNAEFLAYEPQPYFPLKGDPRKPGQMNMLGVVDKDTVLTPDGGLTFGDVTDGLSTTIVAVELAGGDISWTEPRDVTIDEFIAAVRRSPSDEGLRPLHPGGVLCLFADGGVRLIPNDAPSETLRAFCTRAGGEAVKIPGTE